MQEGAYLVGMARHMDQQELGSQVAGLVVPYAQELRELGVDEARLKELAELGGGAALADPREVFLKGRRPHAMSIEIWPWLVVFAALLLLFDIAQRRLGSGVSGWLVMALRRAWSRA